MDRVANHLLWARERRTELIRRGIRDSCGQTEGERQLSEDFERLYVGLESVIGMEKQLTSRHLRSNLFSERYQPIQPKEVEVGRDGDVPLHAYTTPVSSTLGQFFEDRSLRPYLFTRVPPPSMQQDRGVYASFTDGQVFRDLTSEGK